MIEVDVKNEKVIAALKKAPIEIMRHWSQAGREAGKEIIGTKGLKNYPSEPSGRKIPGGYLRGIGYIYADGTSKNNSERYGTQFTVRQRGTTQTVIGNRASYAEHLTGSRIGGGGQSYVINKNISGGGWRILLDVAKEKINILNRIYTLWMIKALRKLGLQ